MHTVGTNLKRLRVHGKRAALSACLQLFEKKVDFYLKLW